MIQTLMMTLMLKMNLTRCEIWDSISNSYNWKSQHRSNKMQCNWGNKYIVLTRVVLDKKDMIRIRYDIFPVSADTIRDTLEIPCMSFIWRVLTNWSQLAFVTAIPQVSAQHEISTACMLRHIIGFLNAMVILVPIIASQIEFSSNHW